MRTFSTAALLTVLLTAQALADEPVLPGAVYEPSDFAQFAPVNAREMVERIPGFRLNDTRDDDESRGFGQATENVLINGQRISSKSSSAADVLERIPANTVERIELLEGASLDISGLSGLVVNVIAQADGISGTWEYRSRIIDGQNPLFFGGEVSVAGQRQDFGWTINLNELPRRSSGTGDETVTDAAGNLIEARRIIENNQIPDRNASIGLRWTPPSGLIANLNAEYLFERRERKESLNRVPVIGAPVLQRNLVRNDSTVAEISGDVEFDLLDGRLKLIGVYSDTDSPFTNERVRTEPEGTPLDSTRFKQQTDETELILRGEYKWAALGGSWDASFETAENTLDSEALLFESIGSGALATVNIGDTLVAVEETRSEGFVTYSRGLGDVVQVQVSVGTEVSEISSSGPTGQTRKFTRPKGGVTLSWQYDDATTLNARINRSVGQLDFFDFVSQLDLNDGEDQVGNADIVPEQSWRAELELERQFGSWGAGNVLVFAEALEDIVDQIPIGGGEGPGNIDSGSRFGIEFEGTLNFDPLGLNGAQLIYSASFQDSEIEDPLTGVDRAINEEDLVSIDLEFRHDISGTDLAWGGDWTPSREADNFRVDSVRSELEQPGNFSVFVEHKDLWGMTGRAVLFRPAGNLEKETRTRFSPDRTGVPVEFERTRIEETPILILEFTGTF